MAQYSRMLYELVESVARLAGDWWGGTATGGGATSFIDTVNRLEKDDFFNKLQPPARIHVTTTTDGAAPVGQEREITDWVQSTATGTVATWTTGNIGAGDTYGITHVWTWDEYKNAINLAIDMARDDAILWAVDETSITLAASVYEYTLPTNFVTLHRVTMSNGDGDFDDSSPVDANWWTIVHGVTNKLRFILMPEDAQYQDHFHGDPWASSDLTAGRKLRLEGMGLATRLTTDTSVCNLYPGYVIFQALALLHMSRVQRAENEPDDHRIQGQIWQARADIERSKIIPVQLPADSKRLRE